MKTRIILLLSLFVFIFPASAQTGGKDHHYILEIVESLDKIIRQQKNEQSSQVVLSRITGAKPLMKDGSYQGHQVFHNKELTGLIALNFQNNKATIAVFSTPPLRVRYATKRYKAFRSLLLKQYKESRHNHFELGDKVIARIKKQARKVTIDVYREK
jgi:hypothetical protein